VKGESFDNRNTNKSKFERNKFNKVCKYGKKQRHLIDDCYSLINKREKDERNKQTAKASIVEFDSGGDIIFTTSIEEESVSKGILDY